VHRRQTPRLTWLILSIVLLCGCQPAPRVVEHHMLEFGTIIEITLVTDDLAGAERILGQIEERLHRYRSWWHAWEDSDLTRFNDDLRLRQRIPIPDSLAVLLELSKRYYDASGGLFNPAIGELIAAYGFHGETRNQAIIDELRASLPGMSDLLIENGHAQSRHPRLRLDLGGIAKGYAIGLIGDFLKRNGFGNFIVSAGGDLLVAGNRLGRPWRIGIQDPYAPGVIASLELTGDQSLFTSGNYQRRYLQGGQLVHHIIDPRDGLPSQGQSAATVLASDPVLADVAATVLMIDGSHNSVQLALSLGIEEYLIVTDSRDLLVTPAFAERLTIEPNWNLKIIK